MCVQRGIYIHFGQQDNWDLIWGVSFGVNSLALRACGVLGLKSKIQDFGQEGFWLAVLHLGFTGG